MEPVKPDYQSLLGQLGQAAGKAGGALDPKTAAEFDTLLQAKVDDAEPHKTDPMHQAVEESARAASDAIAQGPGLPSLPASPTPVVAAEPLHPSIGAPRKGHPSLPPALVPDMGYRHTVDPHRVEPEGQRVPQKVKRKRHEVAVDADLLAMLKAHGLALPIVNLDDARLLGQTPFEGKQGWVRVGTDAAFTATWRSPRDPAGVYQRVSSSAALWTIETSALDKIQTIEARGEAVTVTRGPGPRPEYPQR